MIPEIKLAPDDGDVAFDLATALALTGQTEEALALIEEHRFKDAAKSNNFRAMWRSPRFRAAAGDPDESMADVFVVGVYVAFLSAKATDNLDAELHIGFYLFASYCLVALVALQFMVVDPPDR